MLVRLRYCHLRSPRTGVTRKGDPVSGVVRGWEGSPVAQLPTSL